MGTVLSYLTRRSSSPRIKSDPFEVMAEGTPRDAVSHTSGAWVSQSELKRYTDAFQVVQEFLKNSGSMIDRQRFLESELQKLETCQERLRRFTEDHARASETGSENISSSNRPSELERKYEQFYDHERMDVIEYIEGSRIEKERNKWTEVDDQRIACLIFEESWEAAQILRESFLQGASKIMTSAPSLGTQFLDIKANESGDVWFYVKDSGHQFSSLDQSSMTGLKAIMKETAETCDVDALVKRTLNALYTRQEQGRFNDFTGDFLAKSTLKKYVEKCCKYAWKLVCQTPPYVIEGNYLMRKSDRVFDPLAHQVCREFACSEHNSGYINIVVWPGLFEGSSRRVIRKTEVVLKSLETS